MGIVRTIALIVLGISFFVFVLFFGRLPALRRTPIATLHKWVFLHIPHGLVALDEVVTGRRLTRSLARFIDYMIHDRHPTIVIFFLSLLVGGEYLYLPSAWPMMSTWHRVAGAIVILLPYVFLYLSVMADPGYITPENHAYYMSLYPYDYSIFHPGQECRTCGFLKPPRSKHCSICKRCVARLDHHCIFINGCVGYGNHRWFVLLLLSTAFLTAYGALLGFSLLSNLITSRYPDWSLWPPRNMDITRYLLIWSWGLQDNVNMGAVSLLAALTSPLVWGLLVYTVWLIYCGTTTNESLKWSDLRDDMDDGLVFKRRMSPDRPRDTRLESTWTRWPLDAQQVLVRTDDGMPPGPGGPGEGAWDRVWNIRGVENLYDMGFWDNLMDVFVRDYSFGASREQPAVENDTRRRKAPKTSRF
ncbi:DHHC zinc finger domain-containing protein [Sodiomyces alkalinus F11]|uniref:Palmitoyltransferase n=1 Tax=Sodiomyces alkalinus (strain CBS 110278 / VKM F-3762 / F11) TaxID=1314773 RepID=A0A3N2PK23_SODAK|nr:DHHC zinc finger domain-containing protein [Sodiomyces alkalinus F11]ROT34882.1 DHHC zinc finger domain-containing protein [Sodiomyces alkalinus F11]